MIYKFKIQDYFNIALLVSLFVAVLLIFSSSGNKRQENKILVESEPTPITWGRNREFPPDFTEDEKIILTEQYHDYERTSEEMDKAYEHFRELLKTYRSSNSELTVVSYKEDCFARPVILNVKSGQNIKIINLSDAEISLGGFDDQTLKIDAHQTINYKVNLVEHENNQKIWGYSCSEKGLAGYFVKV